MKILKKIFSLIKKREKISEDTIINGGIQSVILYDKILSVSLYDKILQAKIDKLLETDWFIRDFTKALKAKYSTGIKPDDRNQSK